MSYQRYPTPRERRRTWIILAVVVMAVGLCAALVAYTLLFFDARTRPAAPAAPPTLVVPTLTVGSDSAEPTPAPPTPTATAQPTATVTPLPTPPPVSRADLRAAAWATPPVFDGLVDEWRPIQGYTTPHITAQSGSWDGSRDVDAVWWLGWDAQFLYVAVAVVDNVHVQTQPAQFAYRGDSLELQIDTDRDGDFGPEVSADDFQYVISPGNFLADVPAGAYRFRGGGNLGMADYPGTGATVQSRRTADGYTLEARIPWSDMGVRPQAGLTLGVALSLNDNDTLDSAEQEVMLSHVPARAWLDPTSWGTLTLDP